MSKIRNVQLSIWVPWLSLAKLIHKINHHAVQDKMAQIQSQTLPVRLIRVVERMAHWCT